MTLGIEIGVDMTPEGAHVIAMYVLPDSTRCVFYSQFHPQQRTWVELTDEEMNVIWSDQKRTGESITKAIEAKLRSKNEY